MDLATLFVCVTSILIGQCWCQNSSLILTTLPAIPTHGSFLASSIDHNSPTAGKAAGSSAHPLPTIPVGNLTTETPAWYKCVSQIQVEDSGIENIAKVMKVWCGNYQQMTDCLSRDLAVNEPTNPLDFFINLTFDKVALRSRSELVCAKLKEKSDKLTCADTANNTLADTCAEGFSDGIGQVFDLHRKRNLPKEVYLEAACEVTLHTTLCLRDTLTRCEDDVQLLLLSYYSLFTNDTCVAKHRCAREADQTLTREQTDPEPTSLLDFLILGLRTDCKSYSARYACYARELHNITNFRDLWLSLTFNHDNAIASQKTYCEQIEERVIPRITSECFNKSQLALAACEVGFGREVEAIREEWFKNSEFDGLELQTLACRTSATRATCLDTAMQPCGPEVARAMAASEAGVLPDICHRLLVISPSKKSIFSAPVGAGNATGGSLSNQTNRDNQTVTDESYRHDQNPATNQGSNRDVGQQVPDKPADKPFTRNENVTAKTADSLGTNSAESEQISKQRIDSSPSRNQSHDDSNGTDIATRAAGFQILLQLLLAMCVSSFLVR